MLVMLELTIAVMETDLVPNIVKSDRNLNINHLFKLQVRGT